MLLLKNVNIMQERLNCSWYWKVANGKKNQFVLDQSILANAQLVGISNQHQDLCWSFW